MTIEKTRALVLSRVWQAFAQSGVDISSLSQESQEKLAGKITDAMLILVDDLLEEAEAEQVAAEPAAVESVAENEHGEKIIWRGRPFMSLVEHYTLTSERLKIVHGFFGRDIENYELIRIQDIDLNQALGERMLGIGDIAIRGQDASKPIIELRNVKNPEEVYETLRRAWMEARKRYGLQFREYM
jgi:Xaa-Pro aminopeptidase